MQTIRRCRSGSPTPRGCPMCWLCSDISTSAAVQSRAREFLTWVLAHPRKTPQPLPGMILLDLMGGVALLLWGLHMVHSGIVRAFGSDLRRFLGLALRNRLLAFIAGIFVT